MNTLAEVAKHAKTAMHKAVENTRHEMSTIRSGKASVSFLDGIRVEAYGNLMPLNQVASIMAPEARLLTVQPWDRGLMGGIEKAIQSSDLGLNPSNDGELIRIPLPALTEERRKELVRVVKKLAEEGRISIRHSRTDGISKAKKVEHVSDDDKHHAEKELQTLHDEAIHEIEDLVKAKEQEIMAV